MLRLLPIHFKASRMIKRARQLQRDGAHDDANRVAQSAIDLVNNCAVAGDPACCAFVVAETPFLDSLARDAGHAGATITQITTAMRICESTCQNMALHTPKHYPKGQALLEWYRRRHSELEKAKGT